MVSPAKELPLNRNDPNEPNRRSDQNINTLHHENIPQQRDQQNIEASLKATNFNLDVKISTPTANEQPPFGNTIDPRQQGEGSDEIKPLTGPSNNPASLKSDVSKSVSAQSKQPPTLSISTGV